MQIYYYAATGLPFPRVDKRLLHRSKDRRIPARRQH